MNPSAAAPRGLIRGDDCVLTIIDVQEKLTAVMSGQERLRANVVRLVRFAALAGLPLVVTEQEKLGPTIDEVRRHLPADQATLAKITFDCFREPSFRDALAAIDRRTLVLCGIEAHICVAQTALTALAEGYRVQVVADAAACRSEHNRTVALERVARAGAEVTSTEMFIYEVLERAGTDLFKAVLPLVK